MTGERKKERKKEKTGTRNENLKLQQKRKIKQLKKNEIVCWLPELVEEASEDFFAGMLASPGPEGVQASKSFFVGGSSGYVISCRSAPTSALP